jgi:hypothetical protein
MWVVVALSRGFPFRFARLESVLQMEKETLKIKSKQFVLVTR